MLGHNLLRMFREDLKEKSFNFQQMTSLPLIPGPKKRKAAGPAQQTAEEVYCIYLCICRSRKIEKYVLNRRLGY